MRRTSDEQDNVGVESARMGTSTLGKTARFYQKQRIKKQYAEMRRAGRKTAAFEQFVSNPMSRVKRKRVWIPQKKKGGLLVLGILLLCTVFLCGMSACSALMEGGFSGVAISTYPSADADMLAAEAQYCEMEAELQDYLDHYRETHSYDHYVFHLDTIEHDPYVLISILTAWEAGPWTIDEVQDKLQQLFDMQYILTETVTTDDEGETTCTVTLENRDLSHLPLYVLDEVQSSAYRLYMSTLGNRLDLFPDSAYITLYANQDRPSYAVSSEALTNERFAAMIKEGEKYLNYPYVWGGANPSTSFDCSGFVSWVLNHSGWSVGRQTAQGLCNLCTPVSPANARPGDLIFFKGTYKTNGVSHVGIYVGDGMMLHCGDPIQYTSIQTKYWQAHFYQFGQLPQ